MYRNLAVLLVMLLGGCALKPYKMDIYQGNFVTPEMRAQLKPGMTRQQVRYVLGTPMVSDPLHAYRWDYVFRHEHGGKLMEQQHLVLTFMGDKLQRIDDGKQVIQAEPEAVAQESKTPPAVALLEPPPPVVAAPEVESLENSATQDESVADIEQALQEWVAAWSSRHVERYFASYAASFKPDGMSNAAWRKQRRDRLSKPRYIEVTLAKLHIERQDETHARATFEQQYRADARHDTSRKTVQLEKIGGAWLIVAEHTTGKQK